MNDFPLSFNAIAWLLIAGAGFVAFAKIYGLIFMNGKSPHRVGAAMTGARAEGTEWRTGEAGGEGYVMADGELWRATSQDALTIGDPVDIVAVKGLELRVRKKTERSARQ